MDCVESYSVLRDAVESARVLRNVVDCVESSCVLRDVVDCVESSLCHRRCC